MKKVNLLVGLFGSLALIAGATSCSSLTGTIGNQDGNFTAHEKQNVEALTGIKLLESTFSANPSIKKARNIEASETIDTTDIEKVLPSIDVLLNNGSIIESTVTEEETIINEVTYSYKEVITYKDSELKDATYTLVYNKESFENNKDHDKDHDDDDDERSHGESVRKAQNNDTTTENPANPDENTDAEVNPDANPEEKPTEKPETKPEEDKKPNKEEIETKEKLVGLVLLSETETYAFKAMNKTEIEEDEQESKRSFKIELNETSFIEVMEKSEVEEDEKETKFEYTFVQDGKVELNYALKIEDEKDELLEVTYEVNEIEYEVTKFVKEDKEIYKVEREDNKDHEETFFFTKIVNEDGTTSFVRN